MLEMARAAPDRVAVYGIENHAGTPVYVHAKTCVVDDTWATIGSDNFNRRSWTHDSELSAVVVDPAGDYARQPAAHPRRRAPRPRAPTTWPTASTPAGMFAAYAESRRRARQLARRRARSGRGRRAGCVASSRPSSAGWPGRSRSAPYLLVHDPDGRPKPLRKRDEF